MFLGDRGFDFIDEILKRLNKQDSFILTKIHCELEQNFFDIFVTIYIENLAHIKLPTVVVRTTGAEIGKGSIRLNIPFIVEMFEQLVVSCFSLATILIN